MPRLGFHARFPDRRHRRIAVRRARRAARPGSGSSTRRPTGRRSWRRVLPVLRAQGEPYASGSIDAQHAVMAAAHREQASRSCSTARGRTSCSAATTCTSASRAAGLLLVRAPVRCGTRAARAGSLEGPRRRRVRAVGGGPRGSAARTRSRRFGRGPAGGSAFACSGRAGGQTAMCEARREPGTFLAPTLWHALSTAGLPALLRYEDRNSMAFGIEARVPFLDVRLVELAMRLPDRLRVEARRDQGGPPPRDGLTASPRGRAAAGQGGLRGATARLAGRPAATRSATSCATARCRNAAGSRRPRSSESSPTASPAGGGPSTCGACSSWRRGSERSGRTRRVSAAPRNGIAWRRRSRTEQSDDCPGRARRLDGRGQRLAARRGILASRR